MDLRSQKTKRAIQEAFYALRVKKHTSRIRVGEICERAQINKSTFYRHYADVFALEGQMENEMVREIVDDIRTGPSIREDAKGFFAALDEAFNGEKNRGRKEVLFSSDPCRLLTKVEDTLRQCYLETEQHSFEDNILISYALGGTFAVFRIGWMYIANPDVPAIYEMLGQYTQRTLLLDQEK